MLKKLLRGLTCLPIIVVTAASIYPTNAKAEDLAMQGLIAPSLIYVNMEEDLATRGLISPTPIHPDMEEDLSTRGLIAPSPVYATVEKGWTEDKSIGTEETIKDNWAEIEEKKKLEFKAKLGVNMGTTSNTLMGMNFSEGERTEVRFDSGLRLDDDGSVTLDGKFKFGDLKYSNGKGDLKNFDFEANLAFEDDHKFETCTASISLGANVDIYDSTQTYEGVEINIKNITAGPMLRLKVDSEYVDFMLTYMLGFGEAGNTVQGKNNVLKNKGRLNLDFKLGPVGLEGYAEGEASLFDIHDIFRDTFEAAVGGRATYDLTDHLTAELAYEHGWELGRQDNVESNTLMGGLSLKF